MIINKQNRAEIDEQNVIKIISKMVAGSYNNENFIEYDSFGHIIRKLLITYSLRNIFMREHIISSMNKKIDDAAILNWYRKIIDEI